MTTIRVTDETHRRIADLAHRTGNPMTEVVSRAVDALERQVYFGEVNRRLIGAYGGGMKSEGFT